MTQYPIFFRLCLVDSSKYADLRGISRSDLAKYLPVRLEKIVSSKDFCMHLPYHCRVQFAGILRGLCCAHESSKTPSEIIADLLGNVCKDFFSSVPVDLVVDKSLSQHYLGPHDASSLSDFDLDIVQKEASRVISWIQSTGVDQLHEVSKAMQSLCQKCHNHPSQEQQEQSKRFLQEDKQLMLVHPDACRVFFRAGFCHALGVAVENLIAIRNLLTTQKSEIEREFQLQWDQACALQGAPQIVQALVDTGCGTESQVIAAMALCDNDADAALIFLTSANLDEIKLSRDQKYQLQSKISIKANDDRQKMKNVFDEKLRQISESVERVDVIEGLIALILEQCAVVRPFADVVFI